jgi:hypothetical protein
MPDHHSGVAAYDLQFHCKKGLTPQSYNVMDTLESLVHSIESHLDGIDPVVDEEIPCMEDLSDLEEDMTIYMGQD